MYKLWEVYDGVKIEFYVVNTTNRRVQSAWDSYLTAAQVCAKLNKGR